MTTGQEPVLTLKAVDVGYLPAVPVLEGVDLEVRPGEAIGIIGRNGAGKSCLALTLAGELPLQGGAVDLKGQSILALASAARVRRGLSLVPEGRQIFGQLSVKDNLVVAAYGARRKLTAKLWRRLTEQFPILQTKADHVAATLSGGEQQMLAIARALTQEPSVIVFDEPSLGLAPIAIDNLSQVLEGIRADGVGLLLMEQNRGLLEDLCREVKLLDAGRVRATLAPEELSRPEVMATYLGHAGSSNAL